LARSKYSNLDDVKKPALISSPQVGSLILIKREWEEKSQCGIFPHLDHNDRSGSPLFTPLSRHREDDLSQAAMRAISARPSLQVADPR